MLGDGGRQIVDASVKSMITLALGFPLLAASLLLLRALRRDGSLWGHALPELLSEEILLLLATPPPAKPRSDPEVSVPAPSSQKSLTLNQKIPNVPPNQNKSRLLTRAQYTIVFWGGLCSSRTNQ